MKSEINTLKSKGAWTLVKRPADTKVIGCRWVLRPNYHANGKIERRKARLVAKGFNQRPGIDFDETFSPVARQGTIRTFMAIAAEMNLKVFQLDVVLAYINGDLEETIYTGSLSGLSQPKSLGNSEVMFSWENRSLYCENGAQSWAVSAQVLGSISSRL